MALAAPAQAQAPVQVVEVELHLPEGADTQGLSELVAVRKGQPLSSRTVRRSIERLWATGRFTDVVATSVPVPGGTKVVFELAVLQRLAVLTFEGNTVLSDDELRKASGLAEQTLFDPERLPAVLAALTEAYREQGYDEVQVQVRQEPTPTGVQLLLTLKEGSPTRVHSVTVTGSPGLPLARLLKVLGLEVGSVLDRSTLSEGVERLRGVLQQERFFQARVGEPDLRVEGTRATVAVPLSAGPRFTFHFHGNHRFSARFLSSVLAYDGSEPLDRSMTDRLAQRLKAFYRYRGYHDARVVTREVRKPGGEEAVLAFDVEEGPRLYLQAVRFEGNKAFSDALLRQMLTEVVSSRSPRLQQELPLLEDPNERSSPGRPPRADEPGPEAFSTVLVEDAFVAAAELMTEAYRQRGYLQAQVRFREATWEDQDASAHFEIVEGVQTLVQGVRMVGLPPQVQLPPGIKRGSPLSYEELERSRISMVQSLGRQGYLFVRAEAEARISEDGRSATLMFQVEPGPRVRVGQVILQGLVRSNDSMVRANLRVREGDILDPEALYDTQRQLLQLNIFRQVAVRLIAPETVEPTKDVVVELRERPRIDGDVSGGYFLVDGPRVQVDTAYPNVDGRGLNLAARGKLNYVGWSTLVFSQNRTGADRSQLEGLNGLGGRGMISLSQPRLYALLPLNIGARLDFIGERVHRPSYVFTRFAAVTSLDWAATRWLSLSLQGEVENDRVRPLGSGGSLAVLGRADQERLRFPFGVFSMTSLRPIATLDFRDNPAHPRRGVLFSASSEFIRGLSVHPTTLSGAGLPPFPIDALKLSGALSLYVPVGAKTVLALSGRAGAIRHLTPGARSIPPKRFFLGGASSMRGFREDGVLAQDRREALHRQVNACNALLYPLGCSPEALSLEKGQTPASEGGELFTLAKAELRFPVYGAVEMGLFFETGNLWLDPTLYDPTALRYVGGVGLRYGTPVGPLALDFGVNLDRDVLVQEPTGQLHFSIGLF